MKLMLIPYGILTFYAKSDVLRTLRELKPRHPAVNLRFIQRIHKALVTTRLGNLVRTLGICAGRMVRSAHPTTKGWCAMRTLRELKPRHPAVDLRFIQRVHKGTLLLRLNRNRHSPLVRVPLLIVCNHRMRHLAAQ